MPPKGLNVIRTGLLIPMQSRDRSQSQSLRSIPNLLTDGEQSSPRPSQESMQTTVPRALSSSNMNNLNGSEPETNSLPNSPSRNPPNLFAAKADKRKSRLGTRAHLPKQITINPEDEDRVFIKGELLYLRKPSREAPATFYFAVKQGQLHRYKSSVEVIRIDLV